MRNSVDAGSSGRDCRDKSRNVCGSRIVQERNGFSQSNNWRKVTHTRKLKMAEHWHKLIEHIPLVSMVAGNQVQRFEFKDLIGSLIVGVASAIFASYITVKELSVEMRYAAAQLTKLESVVYQKLDTFSKENQESRDRLSRLEERIINNHPQSVMNGKSK